VFSVSFFLSLTERAMLSLIRLRTRPLPGPHLISRLPIMQAILGCLALIAATLSTSAFADGDPYAGVMSQMQTSSLNIGSQIVPVAFKLLGTLFLIQFTLRNYKSVLEVAMSGEWFPVLGKVALSVIWAGFLSYLITNHYDVLNQIYSSFMQLGSMASGGVTMDPGVIMESGIKLQNNMVVAFNQATGANDGLIAAMKNFLPAFMLSIACLAIMLAFFMVSLSVAIATLEFYMIAAAAPIAFATGGLDALKQGSIAPLQTMLSVGYRILISGVIVGTLHNMMHVWDASFSQVTQGDWTVIWEAVFGSLLMAVASFSSGKIAGALASGQSNLSGNDAMFAGLQMVNTIANATTAMAAVATAGAAAAGMAGGAAAKAAGLGGMTPESFGNALGKGFISMTDAFPSGGKGGSLSNASPGSSGGSGGGAQSSQRVANELLGPMGSGFTQPPTPTSDLGGAGADTAAAPSASSEPVGNASDASIGGSTGQAAASQSQQQKPSALSKLAEAGKNQLTSMHGNDTGSVHVHVDPRAAME
jgi:P-type conjugative transfer protein TrbL